MNVEVIYLDEVSAESGVREFRGIGRYCPHCREYRRLVLDLWRDYPTDDLLKCTICRGPTQHMGETIYLYPVESCWAGVIREMMVDPGHPGYSLEGYSGRTVGDKDNPIWSYRRVWGDLKAVKW